MSSHKKYSGIVINQNQKIASSGDNVNVTDTTWRYQDFVLPSDYVRGTNETEQVIPRLSGFQLLVGITDVDTAVMDWVLEYKELGLSWISLASGSTTGAHMAGDKVWMDFYFDSPVELPVAALTDRIRIGVKGSASSGVEKIWLANPNPNDFAQKSTWAYDAGGDIEITASVKTSFNFRLLGLVGDEGTDFLGNSYRSVAISTPVDNVSTAHSDVANKIWMSKPNPSRFAVESLYFDVRDVYQDPNGVASVIDNVVVDPVTPGVWFNIYYSSDGDPVTSADDWDNKLWKRVPKTFHAIKRDSHKLPKPVVAKYIKVEFTHLQAQHYSPGQLARPIAYKKHPKWVLDYFLAQLTELSSTSTLLSGRQGIIFDAYDLAYNYYLDDIRQEPDSPVEIDQAFIRDTTDFLRTRDSYSDQMDPIMASKISIALTPYTTQPNQRGMADSLLTNMAISAVNTSLSADYPVEYTTSGLFPDIIELRSSDTVFENQYPVMFFYLTCRHRYREVTAPLSHDRAYFVGIREIAFTRDHYAVPFDGTHYIESGADFVNTERNDFTNDNGVLVVS